MTIEPKIAARQVGSLDWYAIDRILAVPHREDDQPCACDECMSYGAEEAGADWYRLSPVRRIALRVLDSDDDRLAPLRDVIHENVNDGDPTFLVTAIPDSTGARE